MGVWVPPPGEDELLAVGDGPSRISFEERHLDLADAGVGVELREGRVGGGPVSVLDDDLQRAEWRHAVVLASHSPRCHLILFNDSGADGRAGTLQRRENCEAEETRSTRGTGDLNGEVCARRGNTGARKQRNSDPSATRPSHVTTQGPRTPEPSPGGALRGGPLWTAEVVKSKRLSVRIIGAVCTFLELFCGRLSSKVFKFLKIDF